MSRAGVFLSIRWAKIKECATFQRIPIIRIPIITAQRSKFGQTIHVKGNFQQDEATTHTAAKTKRRWCQDNFSDFWANGIWSGNIPDLSLIENLWASSGIRSTSWTCDVKSRSHRKLSVGLVLLLSRNAGQRNVWDAGAFVGLCGEVWRIH